MQDLEQQKMHRETSRNRTSYTKQNSHQNNNHSNHPSQRGAVVAAAAGNPAARKIQERAEAYVNKPGGGGGM